MCDKFRFLNYYWGKCLYCLFLTSMSFSSSIEPFLQYILSIYFLVTAVCFLVLSFKDRERDLQQWEVDKKIIEQTVYED